MNLVGFETSKIDVSDNFQVKDHFTYMKASDEILRNFLNELISYHVNPKPD
ncbi:MAG: hypothetical protein DCO95_14610 [Roseivirga sp. XM-24bin3]|nr:MAG: hypothetical protein DCO95_14610 [Roseivirga sp. XM-24bin3]